MWKMEGCYLFLRGDFIQICMKKLTKFTKFCVLKCSWFLFFHRKFRKFYLFGSNVDVALGPEIFWGKIMLSNHVRYKIFYWARVKSEFFKIYSLASLNCKLFSCMNAHYWMRFNFEFPFRNFNFMIWLDFY